MSFGTYILEPKLCSDVQLYIGMLYPWQMEIPGWVETHAWI